MKIHNVEQGSPEWFQLHIGRITAGSFSQILTAECEARVGEMPKTLLYKKVAEAWRKQPLPQIGNWQLEQGLLLEEEALPFFSLQYDCELKRVGFIESDDSRCGCSPDSLIGDDNGLEAKCPNAETHVRYLMENRLPPAYAPQVHGCIYVTGFPRWTFLSYRRGFPHFAITIERDEEIMKRIASALSAYHTAFDDAMSRLSKYESKP